MNTEPSKTQTKMIGSRGSHDWILRTLRTLPQGKALDVPAGKGVLSDYMRELGFDVHCADIDPGLLEAKGFPFERVNLNSPLPYEDHSFDVVVCANALHRIAHFRVALAEFSRILVPGGSLLMSVNNYANIAKRFKFLFCGSLSETNNELTHLQTIKDAEANFRQALFYPAIEIGLEASGLEVVQVKAQARRLNHYLLSPFAVLVYLGTFFHGSKTFRRNRLKVTRGAAINFGGKSIFIHARKPK